MPPKKSSKFSRNDIYYWEQRVYQPAFKDSEGTERKNGSYYVKIQAHGERRGFSLKDIAQRAAAKSAQALDELIRMHGWTNGLAEFRGEKPKPKNNLTLVAYLPEVANIGVIPAHALKAAIWSDKGSAVHFAYTTTPPTEPR